MVSDLQGSPHRQDAAAAGRFGAGRRGRGAVRHWRHADPPRRRGSGAGLFAARALPQPSHPLALLSLADLYESVKKPQMAIKVYERMPASSPLKRNAQIQLAVDLDSADRTEEAIKILKGVVSEDSKDLEAIMALGNLERGRKKFGD